MVLFGVDRLEENKALLTGRVALLTSPSGRTMENLSTIEHLQKFCDLRLLLAPEHGVRGDKPAGALFTDEVDEESGLPVCSLYTKETKRLSSQVLNRFDTLVYDIADVGCRYYTFISTLLYCMEDCAREGKRFVVLDRPNPLGDLIDGGVLQMENSSFVGIYDLPVCYGLTCGELAMMMNQERKIGCDLHVVFCKGLHRDMTFRDWARPWIMPSLNIPRYETALLYPGTCLLEGTNCSEGRGTADPFAIVGAPFVKAEEFAKEFKKCNLSGIEATPVYFTPTTSKHQGILCGGIHLHITDESVLQPVALGIKLLDLFRTMYPNDFQFLPPVKEGGRPFISLLAGHREFESPQWDAGKLLQRYQQECENFKQRRQPFEVYERSV